jgi:hypothetical protein
VLYQRDPADDRWFEVAQVIGPDGGDFGGAVAISGTRLVVGAERAAGGGAAYVYDRTGPTTWTLAARFTEEAAQKLGHAVAVQGDRVVVGSLAGAFVYDRGNAGWNRDAALAPPDPQAAQFGAAVAVQGDLVLAGAPGYSDAVTGSGAAYLFQRGPGGVWLPRPALLPATPRERGGFGRGVALEAFRAVVSELDRTAGAGITSVFRPQPDGTWLEVGRHRDDAGAGAGFSFDGVELDAQVSMSGVIAVAGYPVHDGGGAVVVRELTGM